MKALENSLWRYKHAFYPRLVLHLPGSGMEVKRKNPKQGLLPLGNTAKTGRDQPKARRIFKKEVLSRCFF